jgi:hypothetical protein
MTPTATDERPSTQEHPITAADLPPNLADAPFEQQAKCIRRLFALSPAAFATCLKLPEATVTQWEQAGCDVTALTEVERQAHEAIIDLAEFLGDYFRNDNIVKWVDSKPKSLNGLTPKAYARQQPECFIDYCNRLGAIGR